MSMKFNLSSQHQNELLQQTLGMVQHCRTELDQLQASCKSRSRALQQQKDTKIQNAQRDTQRAHDQSVSEWEGYRQEARQNLQTEVRASKEELQNELDTTKQHVKKQLSDGEYDWFLSKQRLVKEVEADQEAAQEAYKKAKANLKQHGASFTSLSEEAEHVLQRHGGDLKIHGGDLLDPPDDSDHFAAHQQTAARIVQLIQQFRKTFWVRFQEERWYLIALLLGMVVLPFPIYLVRDDLLLAGVVSCGVAFAGSVLSYWLSRRFSRVAAKQFEETFATAFATGKQQLLAAQHQNKVVRNQNLEKLAAYQRTQLDKLNEQWEVKQHELKSYLAKRIGELQSLAEKRSAMLQQQCEEKESALLEKYQPVLERLEQEQMDREKGWEAEFTAGMVSLDREHDLAHTALREKFAEHVRSVSMEIAGTVEMVAPSAQDLSASFVDWEPPVQSPQAVPFGEVAVPWKQLAASQLPEDEFPVPATSAIPAALDLIHAPSLVIESSAHKEEANDLLRLMMVRLLTSVPPGKLRFTVVDAIGLGQSFSSFMHLADYDEEVIQHRIWTEPNHIQTRLTDLTQHMENVIQSYLRNEYATIQEYNEQAGEVAEAFRVLVVANFPAGFTEESAQRLLSIASSGPRCGVFLLLSVDSSQAMPRNFDLDELRSHANVVVLSDGHLRWEKSPLSDYPIVCDTLPAEDQMTRIMHRLGQFVQQAGRVEVPFSSVAPDSETWWTGDSRNEISVALGRTGATKHQELRLGRGTSQHVLISGKTGSGKSTLLHALITNLSLNYSPDEVQFYLIDFKKGVEFKPYAEHALPHARVIAIESEREFGQSVLEKLDGELRRRGDLFRRVGVQGLAGYRDARPDERMPRILLVIDEFQEFFVKEDKISQEASLLLDRLVRQGRAFGIHVLLGSQTLAGAYSLARATIGQMAVRIALQCSASDANLILSDDNDAARLLRRPGEAIYNDANGMVEGNHPFQVVLLSDLEKESYLRELAARYADQEASAESLIVFEGNVASDVAKNPLLRQCWTAPAPAEIPLAPRIWLGEAVAIKEAPALVFHRRSGSNLMIVGQQEETALGMMASGLLSLTAFSPTDSTKRSQLVVLDGTRPEAPTAGYWHSLRETVGIEFAIDKPRDALERLKGLSAELSRRKSEQLDSEVAVFLFIDNLSRFRDLQRGEDDFGFGGFGEEKAESPAEMLAEILRDGPGYGIHTILWSESYTSLMRWLDRPSLRDIESRVLFQMSSTDSSNLMDSSAASQLGPHRAMFYSEDRGRAERFRPYGIPNDDFLLKVRQWQAQRGSENSRQPDAS